MADAEYRDAESRNDPVGTTVWGRVNEQIRKLALIYAVIDVQHGVFMHATWQSPLVAAATRAHDLLGTTIVGVNEAVRQNFPEHVRDDVVTRPEPARLAAAIAEAYAGRNDSRVAHAREVADREYAAPVMGRHWSDLVSAVSEGK